MEVTIIKPLQKAFGKFENFRQNLRTEQEKAGAILAYGYYFELAWKIMQRFLQERGKIANSPREVFRMAALEEFIENPELWFEFLKKRNLTVHTYEEEEANQVINIFEQFSAEITLFMKKV